MSSPFAQSSCIIINFPGSLADVRYWLFRRLTKQSRVVRPILPRNTHRLCGERNEMWNWVSYFWEQIPVQVSYDFSRFRELNPSQNFPWWVLLCVVHSFFPSPGRTMTIQVIIIINCSHKSRQLELAHRSQLPVPRQSKVRVALPASAERCAILGIFPLEWGGRYRTSSQKCECWVGVCSYNKQHDMNTIKIIITLFISRVPSSLFLPSPPPPPTATVAANSTEWVLFSWKALFSTPPHSFIKLLN